MTRARLLLVAMTAIGLATACQPETAGVPASRTLADSADQVLLGVRTILTSADGLKRGELSSDTAYVLRDATTFAFVGRLGFHISFTSDSNAIIGTLDGVRGTLHQTTGLVDLSGNITLTSTKGGEVHGQRGRYDLSANRITLDSGATVGAGPDARSVKTLTTDPTLASLVCTPAC